MSHPQEKYYPALKKLVDLPEWKVYEEFLQERQMGFFLQFLNAEDSTLSALKNRAAETENIMGAIKHLISEVEASRKP